MNIKSLKESIQIFSRKAATAVNWPPVEKDIECAIDDDVVECSEMDSPPYTGIPAPILTPVDDWFSGPYGCPTEKQQDYMVQEAEIKKQEAENRQYWTKESANIHQEMYDLATKSGATTVQLDPIGGSENFQGGSENVHR
mgnify:FL=1|tara:strand:+ start:153 stop:572 length:420 start_codon:yes stop_codon:yes gene_type:complete